LRLVLTKNAPLAGEAPTDVSLEGKSRFVIGRGEPADWVLRDPGKGISSRHCEIVFDGAAYVLRDLSTNGTFLNGATERLEGAQPLRPGDTIGIGPFVIEARATDGAKASPGSAAKPAEDVWMQLTPQRPAAPRGADPAAMVLGAAPASPFAQRADAEPAGGYSNLTVIRPAPKPSPNAGPRPPDPAPRPAEAAPKPVEAPPPPPVAPAVVVPPAAMAGPAISVARDSAAEGEMVRRLLEGLGLGPEALGRLPPGDLAYNVGHLLRVLAVGIKTLQDDSARQRRVIGSRKRASLRDQYGKILRSSATAEGALVMLLRLSAADAATEARQGVADIQAHQQAMLDAAQGGARSLGEELDPKALAQAAPGLGSDIEAKSRLWDMYGSLWQGVEADWPTGFAESFKLFMASRYDENVSG
jgi:type VI secretion system protein ImpI